MTIEETLARLEALCAAASDMPLAPGGIIEPTTSGGHINPQLTFYVAMSKDDAAFIAETRTALPALLAVARAAHAYCRATQADPLAHVRQVGAYNAMATALRALGEGEGT